MELPPGMRIPPEIGEHRLLRDGGRAELGEIQTYPTCNYRIGVAEDSASLVFEVPLGPGVIKRIVFPFGKPAFGELATKIQAALSGVELPG